MPKVASEAPSSLDQLKRWIVGATGVLVVIPALLNGGLDIYNWANKLPKTAAERTNVELFRKYFNKQPVTAFPVAVKMNQGTVEVMFSIYDEGDVFIEYGKNSQWFPFPNRTALASALSPVAVAYAADSPGVTLRGSGPYVETNREQGRSIVRERQYKNGVTERLVIDPQTGRISERTVSAGTAVPNIPGSVTTIPLIDLDKLRAPKP